MLDTLFHALCCGLVLVVLNLRDLYQSVSYTVLILN
jgi:hypothetical protein